MGDKSLRLGKTGFDKRYLKGSDQLSILEEAKAGVDAASFFDLADLFHLTRDELASMFHISLKSLVRYRRSRQKLNPAQGEHVLKMRALHKKGTEIFGSDEAFHRWLDKPAHGLGNRVPVQLMNTSTGIDLIMGEIRRIEWGDLA